MAPSIRLRLFAAATALMIVVAAQPRAASVTASKDIVDTAIAAGSFTSLVAAVKAADLVQQLKSPGPFTVFAPTDAAFAKIPKADLDALLKDKIRLHKVLTHHVFAGNVNSDDLLMLKDLSVADGGRLIIQGPKAALKIGGAAIIKMDIAASNGLIHVIDSVLIPK